MSIIPSPNRHPAGTDYVVQKPITVCGVALDRGAHLPSDSPIRENPRRLETLCRTRALVAQMKAAQPAQATEPPVPMSAREAKPVKESTRGNTKRLRTRGRA